MKPKRGGKRLSNRIKQPLHTITLAPRRSRHGREIVMLADYLKNPEHYEPTEIGIRKSDTLKVAAGPTLKKGKLNGHGSAQGGEPQWWKEA